MKGDYYILDSNQQSIAKNEINNSLMKVRPMLMKIFCKLYNFFNFRFQVKSSTGGCLLKVRNLTPHTILRLPSVRFKS